MTSPLQVDIFKSEIISGFKALRNGGVLVIVGASYGKYPAIYNKLTKLIGHKECIFSREMSHSYNDPLGNRIREFHENIYKHFILSNCESCIPEKAKRHMIRIIENRNGIGESKKWSLFVFRKQSNRRFPLKNV
jgi:hypothetical protein